MFDDLGEDNAGMPQVKADELLEELSGNTSDEISRRRQHFRLSVKASVVLQPGSTSDLLSFKVRGVTGDLSEGGCSALFPVPPKVGDVYRLLFDKTQLDLPMTFVRCVRCRLVREDAFEAGFKFFKTIALPANVASAEASRLIS